MGKKGGETSRKTPLDIKMYADIQKQVYAKNKDGTESKTLITIEDAIRNRLISASLKEKDFLPYLKEIFDRTYGKSKQVYEDTNSADNPAELTDEQKRLLEENYGDELKERKRTRARKTKRAT